MAFEEEKVSQSILHAAVLGRGDMPFETALSHTPRAQINMEDAFGATALAWATTFGTIDQVQQLLQEGADPNIARSARTLPCLMACRQGRTDVLDLLLRSDADVNRCLAGRPLLHNVCCDPGNHSQLPILEVLYAWRN